MNSKAKETAVIKKSKKIPVLDQKENPTGKEFYLPSKQWRKYDHALKSALHKRREQTKTFMFTSAHRLFRNYDCVGNRRLYSKWRRDHYTDAASHEQPILDRALEKHPLLGSSQVGKNLF